MQNESNKIKDLVQEILKLSLVEMSDFLHLLSKEINIPLENLISQPTLKDNSFDDNQSEKETKLFSLQITGFEASKKIDLIKTLREIKGAEITLLKSKEILNNLPYTLENNLQKENAESMKLKLEEAGAVIKLD